jgi:polyphosphate glucokinase
MNVLVVDVGGSHVKVGMTGRDEPVSFKSGPEMTPDRMIEQIRSATNGWDYSAVSLGYPGAVGPNGPEKEPGNLADGWMKFDFERAFGRRVRVVNDAAMQALGGYKEGRMLFLGLGTGLGSALVTERVVIPLELGGLRYGPREILADRLGRAGLKKYGEREWLQVLSEVVADLVEAFRADEILLGGGKSALVDPLPPRCRLGGNKDAIVGGIRLWEEWIEGHDAPPTGAWRVVR